MTSFHESSGFTATEPATVVPSEYPATMSSIGRIPATGSVEKGNMKAIAPAKRPLI